jgi:hypothetical protein
MGKKTTFRQGQKLEIGYDLQKSYAGHRKGTAMTTAQGEMMSNYFSNSETPFITLQQNTK